MLMIFQGFWSRCFSLYKKTSRVLEARSIGDIVCLNVEFGGNAIETPRMCTKEMGGGALMDMGCYTVMYANFIFREKPQKIIAQATLTEQGKNCKQ